MYRYLDTNSGRAGGRFDCRIVGIVMEKGDEKNVSAFNCG